MAFRQAIRLDGQPNCKQVVRPDGRQVALIASLPSVSPSKECKKAGWHAVWMAGGQARPLASDPARQSVGWLVGRIDRCNFSFAPRRASDCTHLIKIAWHASRV